MSINSRRAFASVIFGAQIASVSATELLDVSKAVSDFSSQNAGKEILIPYQELIDTDFDSVKDATQTQFDVYPIKSDVRLYSSTPQVFEFRFPVWLNSVCSLDDLDGFQPGGKLLRAGPRIISVGGYSLRCSDGSQLYQHHRTFVYGAVVTVANGKSWQYQVSNELAGASGQDTNGDGAIDQILIVTNARSSPTTATPVDKVVTILSATTGAVISRVSYEAVR